MWQRYFKRWHNITRARIDHSMLELVPALAGFVPPAILVDKHVYSAFSNASFLRWIRDHQITGFVVTGAETDVYILSSVMAGIDLGLRMTIITDAVASSSDAGHEALLELYDRRFSEQVDTVTHEELLDVWRP
jgi:nicotinamidase-related amidase